MITTAIMILKIFFVAGVTTQRRPWTYVSVLTIAGLKITVQELCES